MIIKITRKPKDDAKHHDHQHLSRRDFLARGLYTGAMTVALPKILLGSMVKNAVADVTCPAPVRDMGGISHLYCEGGMTIGAYMLGDIPSGIAASSANAATRYGVPGGSMLRLGPNFNISQTSIFGAALLQAGIDMGYSNAQWRIVLNRISLGAHYGCNTQDDGGAANTGLVGSVGTLKRSALNKDLRIGVTHKLVPFANGMPASVIRSRPALVDLTRAFSVTPSNLTNSQTVANSAAAAQSLGTLFSSMLGMKTRTGGEAATVNTTCGFLGDVALADPNYGNTLFNPAQIAPLAPLLALGRVTNGEQAYLSSYYNAAIGVVSGVGIQENGFDYHGQTPANIGAAAVRVARHIAMWAAASDKAGAKTALNIVSNGQAIANGFTSATIGTVTGNVQNAIGDAGGNLSASTILCHAPAGQTPPTLKTTGAFDTVNGDVRGSIGSERAIQGLYATAIQWISGTLTNEQKIRLGLGQTDVKTVSLI